MQAEAAPTRARLTSRKHYFGRHEFHGLDICFAFWRGRDDIACVFFPLARRERARFFKNGVQLLSSWWRVIDATNHAPRAPCRCHGATCGNNKNQPTIAASHVARSSESEGMSSSNRCGLHVAGNFYRSRRPVGPSPHRRTHRSGGRAARCLNSRPRRDTLTFFLSFFLSFFLRYKYTSSVHILGGASACMREGEGPIIGEWLQRRPGSAAVGVAAGRTS